MKDTSFTGAVQGVMAAERVRDLQADLDFARDTAFAAQWAATGVMPTIRQPSMFDAFVDTGFGSAGAGAPAAEPVLTGLSASATSTGTGPPRFGGASSQSSGVTVTATSCAGCQGSSSSAAGGPTSSSQQVEVLQDQDVGVFDGQPAGEILNALAAEEGWVAYAWGLVAQGDEVVAAWIYMLPPDVELVGDDPVDFLFVVIEQGEALHPVVKLPGSGLTASPYSVRQYFAGHEVLHWFEGKRTLSVNVNAVTTPPGLGPVDTTGTGTVTGTAPTGTTTSGTGGGGTDKGPKETDPEPGAEDTASVLLEYTNVSIYTRTEPSPNVTVSLLGEVSARADPAKWLYHSFYHIYAWNGSGELSLPLFPALGTDLQLGIVVTADTDDNQRDTELSSLVATLVAQMQNSLYALFHDASVSEIAAVLAGSGTTLDVQPAGGAAVGTSAYWLRWALGFAGPWLAEANLLCEALSLELAEVEWPDPWLVPGDACFWDFDGDYNLYKQP